MSLFLFLFLLHVFFIYFGVYKGEGEVYISSSGMNLYKREREQKLQNQEENYINAL